MTLGTFLLLLFIPIVTAFGFLYWSVWILSDAVKQLQLREMHRTEREIQVNKITNILDPSLEYKKETE
jgi:hypothetical protein